MGFGEGPGGSGSFTLFGGKVRLKISLGLGANGGAGWITVGICSGRLSLKVVAPFSEEDVRIPYTLRGT